MLKISLLLILFWSLVVVSQEAESYQCIEDVLATSPADLNNMTKCNDPKYGAYNPVFTASVIVSSNFSSEVLNFTGLRGIHGDLRIEDLPLLREIVAPAMEGVGGNFSLRNLNTLQNFSFPNLTNIVGTLSLLKLPALKRMDFSAFANMTPQASSSVWEHISTIVISETGLVSMDTTGLSHLDTIDVILINNNKRLSGISMDQLKTVSDRMSLKDNGDYNSIDLPVLDFVGNLAVEYVDQVSVPLLRNVSNDLTFIRNTFLGLEIPILHSVGGCFTLVDNRNATDFDFPNLVAIGSLKMKGNGVPAISFPKLKTVEGSFIVEGHYENITFGALQQVVGPVKLNTTDPKFDCQAAYSLLSGLDQTKNGGLAFEFACCTPNSTFILPPHKSSKSLGIHKNGGVISGITIAGFVGLAAIFFGVCFLRKRRAAGRLEKSEKSKFQEIEGAQIYEAPHTGLPAELPVAYHLRQNVVVIDGTYEVES